MSAFGLGALHSKGMLVISLNHLNNAAIAAKVMPDAILQKSKEQVQKVSHTIKRSEYFLIS